MIHTNGRKIGTDIRGAGLTRKSPEAGRRRKQQERGLAGKQLARAIQDGIGKMIVFRGAENPA